MRVIISFAITLSTPEKQITHSHICVYNFLIIENQLIQLGRLVSPTSVSWAGGAGDPGRAEVQVQRLSRESRCSSSKAVEQEELMFQFEGHPLDSSLLSGAESIFLFYSDLQLIG